MKSNEFFVDLKDAGQLFGVDAEEIARRVGAGEFPVEPTSPTEMMFERGPIERAANEYWKSRGTEDLVWVHPTVFETAAAAAEEQRFYNGAVIAQGKGGAFAIHINASARPANRLRGIKRMGANIAWKIRTFRPKKSVRDAELLA